MNRDNLEHGINEAVQWLRLGVEATGASIVGIGVLLALFFYLRSLLSTRRADFNAIRLILARYLALALEFQLGADILSTAVAPSWDQIGKLGAIAVIRTVLNYFLGQEIREEQSAQKNTDEPVSTELSNPASHEV